MASTPYIDLTAFMAEAQQLAGAVDWGGDGFEEAFERFATALNDEADLTPQGLERTRSHVRKLLVGRLRLFQDRKTYPEITREVIRAPLFLTGLGRSGTSYLNALLAEDPSHYAPRHWQIWTLSPPPLVRGADTRVQIAAGEQFIRDEGWQDPEVRITHDYQAANAAEDTLIHEYAFRTGSFQFFWNVPSFGEWLSMADLAPAYRIERKVLQALQYGGRQGRWVIKSPVHLAQLGYLLAEFPDARMVVNHRDPVKTLGSIFSMRAAHRKQCGNAPVQVDRAFALAVVEGNARALETMMELRKAAAVDERFVDIAYLDLESDPIGQVAKVYARLGDTPSAAALAKMTRYMRENRKGRFGAHKYGLEEIGLRVEEVRERFKPYTDYFDIPYEV